MLFRCSLNGRSPHGIRSTTTWIPTRDAWSTPWDATWISGWIASGNATSSRVSSTMSEKLEADVGSSACRLVSVPLDFLERRQVCRSRRVKCRLGQ